MIVANRKVITSSQYKQDGFPYIKENKDEKAVGFAEEVANLGWVPEPIFVMDIALTNGKYRLLEIGPVNCAGFYKCDVKTIVKVMTEMA